MVLRIILDKQPVFQTKFFMILVKKGLLDLKIIQKPFDEFHTYSMQWSPDKIQFFIDEEMHLEFPMQAQHSPFDKPFFLLLNLAVGGHWTDGYVAPGFTQATYEIDYVRVYQ